MVFLASEYVLPPIVLSPRDDDARIYGYPMPSEKQ